MGNKETAVIWMAKQQIALFNMYIESRCSIDDYLHNSIKIMQQAEEIERVLIFDAHKHGFSEGAIFGFSDAKYKIVDEKKYYKETYGK